MNRSDSQNRLVDVETTYLEMLAPQQLRASPETPLVVWEAEIPLPELNQFLYHAVGAPWGWVYRRSWTRKQWQEYLESESTRTWVAYLRGTPAGYFEMQRVDHDVEIRSFGLLPQFTGRGMGGDLLTRAVRLAWAWPATRVWLHTCTLDSPAGLKNYLARGFQIYHSRRTQECLPIDGLSPDRS